MANTDKPNNSQEGKVITPLPAGQAHKVPGIVTPKPPLQYEREYNSLHPQMPEEFKGDDILDE